MSTIGRQLDEGGSSVMHVRDEPVWMMPSDRIEGRFYLVTIDPRTDLYICECPDHQYRFRDCKHIRRVQMYRLSADLRQIGRIANDNYPPAA